MAYSIRNVQSADNKSILLALYNEMNKPNDTRTLIEVQNKIDKIIAQNYLHYVNR